jgi:hypothetical protein
VLDLIHYGDVVDELVNARAASASEWVWARQLRYYEISSTGSGGGPPLAASTPTPLAGGNQRAAKVLVLGQGNGTVLKISHNPCKL